MLTGVFLAWLAALPGTALGQASDSSNGEVTGAQAVDPVAASAAIPAATPEAASPPHKDALQGWNAGLTLSGVHDSVTGWALLWYPAVGYAFSDAVSVDVTIPIYSYRLAETLATKPKPDDELVPLRAELGDVVLSIHAQLDPSWIQYQVTGAVTAPSGDETYGLTTGRVTFDIDNHFEKSLGRVTPSLSLGGGDSTTLANRVLTKNYTSLGPLAHFQVGIGLDLYRGATFESDAYEDLPIGDQKIYGPSRGGRATVVVGHHVTEDNGFINSLDVPLDHHATISAYYNRSLRLHTDTVAIGITYVLRSSPPTEDDVMDELFR
jgi:hypothetical protein